MKKQQANHPPDLQTRIGSLCLKNPVLTASGTFGYGEEFLPFVNLGRLGGIVVKGISLAPRSGNPPPRIAETACGLLNSIGLENVGIEHFIAQKMPFLCQTGSPVIVNVLGDSVDEYGEMAARLDDVAGVAAIELNISCPNVKKGGVAFGTDARLAMEVTQAARRRTRKPIIVKLSPNVTDVAHIGRAAEEGGADAVSLINTLLGMAIDVKTQRPVLANIFGGLSGPAIKPVALRMVWQVSSAVTIPVIGIGGIMTWQDAVEFLLAGAQAIQVGTASLVCPSASEDILDGIKQYMIDHGIVQLTDLVGRAKRTPS